MRALMGTILLVSILVALCSCSWLKPTPEVLADSFFYGYAYLDANGNGKIDSDDPGVKDARFTVSLSWGGGSAASTGEDGSAWVIIPGGLSEKDWPVKVRMDPPPDSSYEPVSPAEVTLAYPKGRAAFLFREPPPPRVLADTFFYGYAYLDANGNGEIDPDDPGLVDARFTVSLSWGGGSTASTGEDGRAWIVIPGGLSEKDWPVKARMDPSPDSGYESVGPGEVTLAYPESRAEFLFRESEQGE